MWKPKALLILLAPVALVAAIAVMFSNGEPTYHGHSLSYWLQAPASQTPETAIRAIGTNALPTLIYWIGYHPPAWKKKLAAIPLIADHDLLIDRSVEPTHAKALKAFEILGTNAAPAIPALVKLMKDTTDRTSASSSAYALGCLGEQALTYLTAALSDTDQITRADAIVAISIMPRYGVATNACLIPILKATTGADRYIGFFATNAIRRLAPELLTNTPG